MTPRAVLYARVSGDDRHHEGRNLQGQLDLCRAYAQARGYQVIAELAEDDRGASGAAFELPRLNQVRELAQAGAFDVLVTRELDRLSRSLAKQLFVEEELRRSGVTLEYALAEYADDPEGNLNKNIRAVIAEFERLKISERMSRGRELKVRAGSVLISSRPPFGYRVSQADRKAQLEVVEEEARTIRLIFEWYTLGDNDGQPLSIYAIQQKLNSLALPSPADVRAGIPKDRPAGQWCKATIGRILQNETYAGVWHWRKSAQVRGKRVPRTEEEWLAVAVPAIISRATWEAAVARRAQNQDTARRNVKEDYLLRRRTVCGQCGAKMIALTVRAPRKTRPVVRIYRYYCCPATGKIPSTMAYNCDLPRFPVEQVDRLVWDWVRGLLSDPAALQAGLATMREEQRSRQNPLRSRLEVVDGLLADHARQLERLLDLYLTAEFPREQLDARKGKLLQTMAGLQEERAGLAARLDEQFLNADQVAGLQAFAARVAEKLTAPTRISPASGF
jgi:site-specific DNA recombinase